jgi:hypothetical protein
MGLEAFNTSRDHAVGDVKSRKNIGNLTIPEEGWVSLIFEAGGTFPVHVVDGVDEDDEGFTNEELKAVIKMYDQQIESEDFFGFEPETEEADQVSSTREDLVDILKERKE